MNRNSCRWVATTPTPTSRHKRHYISTGCQHHVTVDSERISRYTRDPGKWFFSFYLYTCTNNHDESRRTRNEDRVSSCRVEHLVSVFYFLFTALIQSAVISDSHSSCRPSSLPLTTTTSFVLNNDWPG